MAGELEINSRYAIIMSMTVNIENKITVLDENLRILPEETTREFFSYFNFLAECIPDFVHEDDRQAFIDLVRNSGEPRSGVFRFLRNTDEYRYCLLSATPLSSGKNTRISLLDIGDAISYNRAAVTETKKTRKILSITDEYLFSYQKSDGILTIMHYDQGHEIIAYKTDLDTWQEILLEDSLVPDEEKSNLEVLIHEFRLTPSNFTVKINCGIRTGTSVYEKLRFIGVRHQDNGETFMLGRILSEESLKQIHHAHSLMEELQLDSLTQVYNKKTITASVVQRIRAALPERFALVIIDLDHFKPVNDQYGHMVGDKVIARAAAKIKEIVGDDGMVGRFGGDEFMLILNNIDNVQILRGMLRAILVQIRKEFEGNFEGIALTCSMGAAVYPTNGVSYDELFKKADFCLYRAKDKGRDRYVFFRDDLHAQLYEASQAAKNAGIKTDGREIQELKYMARFMQLLVTDKNAAIMDVMRHMLGTYALDCITVYTGQDLHCSICVGIRRPEFDNARYARSEDFKRVLGDKTFARVDFSDQLPESAGVFYTEIHRRKICSTVQCIIGTKEQIKGLVSFDRIQAPAQFAEYEVSCAVIFASALALIELQ